MPSPIKNRRSSQSGKAPTLMVQAVGGLEKWKLNLLFGVGLVGMGGIVYWFILPEEGHDHILSEMIVAGGMFFVCAFFAFPLGITRLADKFWPDRWRHERRDPKSPGA